MVEVPRVGNLVKALLLCTALLVAGCGSPEQRAQRHYERGVELLQKQDYVRAALELKSAIQLKGDMLPAWLAMSQIEEHNQNWDKLAAILHKVVELDPKNLDATLRLSRLMLLAGQYDEALKMANAAGSLDQRNANISALKAAILFKLNEMGTAVTEAQTALDIDPSNADALVVLAAYRLSKGDPDGALLVLDRDPEKHAKDLGFQLFKLKIFASTGDLEKTEALLKKLIEYYPKETALQKQLVKLYVQQHREDDAEKEMRAIAAANPSDDANLDIVRFLYNTKGPDAAQEELNDRIKAGGDVFPYQMALVELHYTQGNIADAVTLLDSLIKSPSSPEHALAAKIKLAEVHIGQKNYDAAEALVADILAKDRRNISGLKLRASIRMAEGKFDPAISDLREALNDQPGSPDLLRLLANAYERSGSIELAADQFAEATKASQYNPNIGLEYVAFLRRRGNNAKAEDVLIELLGHSPRNLQILTALSQLKLERQDWTGAQELAESIRRLGDSQGIADQILGEVLAGQGKPEASINVLQNAYSAAPTAVQPMAAVVRAYVRAQQPDKAEAFLQTVLQANPSSAAAYTLLGSVQLGKGEPQQAVESFKAAIAKQPDEPMGYEALANYYTGQQKYDESLKTLQAGLEKKPDSFALRLALAGVRELKGDYEGAISDYESLLKDQPDSLVVVNNLASLLSDHRTDDASQERAVSLAAILRSSPIPQFKDTLGWLQYRRGDYKSAVELLEEAARELPNLALVHYHLGLSYIALGQMPKASQELKKALELAPSGGSGVSQEQIQSALKKAG